MRSADAAAPTITSVFTFNCSPFGSRMRERGARDWNQRLPLDAPVDSNTRDKTSGRRGRAKALVRDRHGLFPELAVPRIFRRNVIDATHQLADPGFLHPLLVLTFQ